MQKIGYLIILIVIIAFIYLKLPRKTNRNVNQTLGNQNFLLEIADNPYLQSKGLSKRNQLCDNCGMLFIFNYEIKQTFWMKDTLIPLDIIFIGKEGIISDIFTANPEPGKGDFQLTLYQSTSPTKYVIELNAGMAKKVGVEKGTKLNLNL